MDISWADSRTRQFSTNVGLITTDGPNGPNLMSAEWTHAVSYAPALIMVNLRAHHATTENIIASKEFGVSLASQQQSMLASMAGTNTGSEVDKVGFAQKLGFSFYPGKQIGALMVDGAAMNAECRLVRHEIIGDRLMLVGEVVELSANEGITPLLYHQGAFWKIGEKIERPLPSVIEEMQKLREKYRKRRPPQAGGEEGMEEARN